MNDFHYVGYMYLLYDVDVCLSIYSIIIELIDSIEKEKKWRDECDIPPYRYTMYIYIYKMKSLSKRRTRESALNDS